MYACSIAVHTDELRMCVVCSRQLYSIHKLLTLFCADYVDEVFGDKSLWPSAPHHKAFARLLVNDFGDKVISNTYYGLGL